MIAIRRRLRMMAWWARRFYRGVLRSENAQRRRITADELNWSGKAPHPDDLDDWIRDQRPAWRRGNR